MTNWVSIEDQLPEDGRWYLVAAKTETPEGGKQVTTMAFLSFDIDIGQPIWLSHNDKKSGEWDNVTHWMILPSPPKKEKTQ